MTEAFPVKKAPSLTEPPDAKTNLRMAWAVLMWGIPQHAVASIFCVNAGRVAEAVHAMRIATAEPALFQRVKDNGETTALDELRKLFDADPDLKLLTHGDA